MKKTLHIDEELLAEARKELGAVTDTDTVRQALQAVLRRAAARRIAAYLGTEEGPVVDVPRRREPAGRQSHKRKRRAA